MRSISLFLGFIFLSLPSLDLADHQRIHSYSSSSSSTLAPTGGFRHDHENKTLHSHRHSPTTFLPSTTTTTLKTRTATMTTSIITTIKPIKATMSYSSSMKDSKLALNDNYLEPIILASSTSSSRGRTGPYFESNRTTFTVTARAGQTILLECAVVLLQGRTVSWVRIRNDNLLLLTVGNQTYASDSRIGLHFRYPNNWRLGILNVNKRDEAEYRCQLSTHPIKSLVYFVKIIAPAVQILDENGHDVSERHYKVDSSLHLTCKASNLDQKSPDKNLSWYKGDRILPGGDSRIKVKLHKNQTSGEATAFLTILSMRKFDSALYTCRASALASNSIQVHVHENQHLLMTMSKSKGGQKNVQKFTLTIISTIILFLPTLPM